MNHESYGKRLKKSAKAKGNFVSVDIYNVYNLLHTLSYFFYKKHHEWVAISFLNENFKCNKIWFNKGPDHTNVSLNLDPKEIIEYAERFNSKYIIISHNHPASSKLIPNYKTKHENIQANKRLQKELFDFSDQDLKSANVYNSYIDKAGLGFAEAVFVAGDYKISGNKKLVDNFSENNTSQNIGCLTTSLVIIIFFMIIF